MDLQKLIDFHNFEFNCHKQMLETCGEDEKEKLEKCINFHKEAYLFLESLK